jgi:hypothetical protein
LRSTDLNSSNLLFRTEASLDDNLDHYLLANLVGQRGMLGVSRFPLISRIIRGVCSRHGVIVCRICVVSGINQSVQDYRRRVLSPTARGLEQCTYLGL